MANNPYRNKVELADGTVLMNLTGDTVEAGKMLSGYTAHDASGAPVTGTIPTKSASDLTASGDTVSVPAGYYASTATKAVASGSTTQGTPSVNSSTGVVTATATVTAGYQQAGTKTNTLQLSTQAGSTTTPTRSEQTIVAAGKYTLGAIKVGAIPSNYYTLAEVFPVGSLYATESSSDNPATILGFGTWTKYAPSAMTWNDLSDTSWSSITGVTSGIYVWKRTA